MSREKKVQEEQNNFLLTYNHDNSSKALSEKYFIKYETKNEDEGNVIRDIILNGFEIWNKGINDYIN